MAIPIIMVHIEPIRCPRKYILFPKDSAKEMLVYDFSLKVKDTLPIWDKNAYKAVIKETDSVFCYGRLRKRQIYDMQGVLQKIGYIIEGIGSSSTHSLTEEDLMVVGRCALRH